MKSLQAKINEGFYKNAGGMIQPQTKDELVNEIKIRLVRKQYNLNDIDTSKITDMSNLFYTFKEYDLSKLDVSKWDTSSVRDMIFMFDECSNFNCDLSNWDTSNVDNMAYMFENCFKFNCDLSGWNVRKVKYMDDMFKFSDMDELPSWYKG